MTNYIIKYRIYRYNIYIYIYIYIYIDIYTNIAVKFLRQSLIIFIIQVFGTIVFIFIVIFTTFRSMCPPAFLRNFLSNTAAYTELRTTLFIQFTSVACSDSVNHNQVQELSIPVLLLTCSQD